MSFFYDYLLNRSTSGFHEALQLAEAADYVVLGLGIETYAASQMQSRLDAIFENWKMLGL